MSSLDEIRAERVKKLQVLKERGILPYPADSKRDKTNSSFLSDFEQLLNNQNKIVLAGRVMSVRTHGGSVFFDIFDGTDKIQVFLKKDEAGEELFELFEQVVDQGDFLEVDGLAYKTKRGEKSLLASSWRMLSKSLLPIPSEWFGLKDADERYRKRFLDFLLNKDLREVFYKKTKFWDETRQFLKKHGFLEVETPTLELTTGGAEARPFRTHHNDFDLDVYLRISIGELWQKRLMAAGFQKTFEIGRAYRNEGSSPEHLQEFTNMEFYSAFMDYQEGMVFTEEMIKTVVQNVFGTFKFSTKGHELDLEGDWPKLDYVETVKRITGIDVLTAREGEMKEKLDELKISYEGKNRERLTDTLWKYCRRQISGPAWLINHPKIVSPLSKSKKDNPELTERVQMILAGAEMTNGFSELNDPIDQKERFEIQQRLLESGDVEAMMPDWDFVEMLEYGMPPTFGFAYGDRLFATLIGLPIREIQLFPLMKPKGD